MIIREEQIDPRFQEFFYKTLEEFEVSTIRRLKPLEFNIIQGIARAYNDSIDLGSFDVFFYLDPNLYFQFEKFSQNNSKLNQLFKEHIAEYVRGYELKLGKIRRLKSKDYKSTEDFPRDKNGKKISAYKTQVFIFSAEIDDIYLLFRDAPCFMIINAVSKKDPERLSFTVHCSGSLKDEVEKIKNEFDTPYPINVPMKHPTPGSEEEWKMAGRTPEEWKEYDKSLERTLVPPKINIPSGMYMTQWRTLSYKNQSE